MSFLRVMLGIFPANAEGPRSKRKVIQNRHNVVVQGLHDLNRPVSGF